MRRYLRASLPLAPLHEDALSELVGASEAEPVDDMDEFLYGPSAQS